jgi:FKBP-type peptidyl-prolyl cis-trans isomerase FklB
MKLLIILLGVILMAGTGIAEKDIVLKSEKDKRSYAIGMDIGKNLKKQPLAIDPDILTRGIRDSLTNSKTLMNEQEYSEALNALKQEMSQKKKVQMKEAGEKNKKEGEAFLAQNRKKDAIVTLPSGLQYKVIKKGAGKIPKSTDVVTVNYKGTLINGTEFDSSYRRGKPASFRVTGVIRGWTEALQLMKEGATWQLFIPPGLAYGERGVGGSIGPNETLIFEVELISIKDQAAE